MLISVQFHVWFYSVLGFASLCFLFFTQMTEDLGMERQHAQNSESIKLLSFFGYLFR